MLPSCTRDWTLAGSFSAMFRSAAAWASSTMPVEAAGMPAGAWAAAGAAAACAKGRAGACCVPMIQPTTRPNTVPATPMTIDSAFIVPIIATCA